MFDCVLDIVLTVRCDVHKVTMTGSMSGRHQIILKVLLKKPICFIIFSLPLLNQIPKPQMSADLLYFMEHTKNNPK